MVSFTVLIETLKFFLDINEPNDSKLRQQFSENIFIGAFTVICLAPLFEEIAFRLPLIKSKYFWISLLFCIIILLSIDILIVKIVCLCYFLGILYIQFFNQNILFCRIIYFLSIITFTLIHVDNFDSNQLGVLNEIDLFFLFIPHLFIAIILTNVRLQSSFFNTIFLHALYNLVILILALTLNF